MKREEIEDGGSRQQRLIRSQVSKTVQTPGPFLIFRDSSSMAPEFWTSDHKLCMGHKPPVGFFLGCKIPDRLVELWVFKAFLRSCWFEESKMMASTASNYSIDLGECFLFFFLCLLQNADTAATHGRAGCYTR